MEGRSGAQKDVRKIIKVRKREEHRNPKVESRSESCCSQDCTRSDPSNILVLGFLTLMKIIEKSQRASSILTISTDVCHIRY